MSEKRPCEASEEGRDRGQESEAEPNNYGEMRIAEQTLRIWLDSARAEKMEPTSRFSGDIARLQFDEIMGARLRFAFENMSWVESCGAKSYGQRWACTRRRTWSGVPRCMEVVLVLCGM